MLRWLINLYSCLWMPCFFGIGQGPNAGETQQAGETGALANFATSTGEGDIGAASNFWKSILSGDPSKIAQVLGPEISGINKRGQEEKKTLAEFGNRSGGTNAKAQTIGDTTRSAVDTLTSNLTSSAAGSLGSIGSGLLSTGLSGHTAAFDMSKTIHDQNLAKLNDIFKSIASVAAAPFTGGASLGGLTGTTGSFSLPSFGGVGGGGGAQGGPASAGSPGSFIGDLSDSGAYWY